LDLPLPPEHGRSLSLPLFLPGGPATSPGHGVLLLATFGGLGLGFGVVAAGLGVGAGVTRGVGFGVARGVGAAVARGVGAGVTAGVGTGVTTGAGVGWGEDLVAPSGDGSALNGEGEGLGWVDAEGLACGFTLGEVSTEGCPAGGDAGACVPDGSVGAGVPADAGLGVGIAAMSAGRRDASACCCSSTPPMPRAIVASTRFRTPRLRMSRTR
jgi:hypothetical protein